MKNSIRALTATFMVFLFAVAAMAQTNSGGISGTVFDSHGAVVPDANVIVTNVGTNQILQMTTSEAGSFTASDLDPVLYRIEVEKKGFEKAIVENFKVDTATTASLKVTLRIGSIGTEVNVTAETSLITMDSATTGQTITERQLSDVPLVNRSVLDLAVTTPNVSGDVGSENPAVTANAPVPGYNLSFNGGRPGSTTILADGANNTGVGIGRAVVSFSPETVQEFTVQTSAYSAQYGQTGGGVMNVTTKSGSNRLTGTALWYTRNPFTNSKVWSNGTLHPVNNQRYNQTSLTVGGPVVLPKLYNGHDRTFFFFAAEPRFSHDFLVVPTLVPTDAMRAGDFGNLTRTSSGWIPSDVATQFGAAGASVGPSTIYQQYNLVNNQLQPIQLSKQNPNFIAFPNNQIPQSMMDPTALKALQFMPHAGAYFLDGNGKIKNFVVNRFVTQNEVRYTGRIDHTLSDKNHINGRYTLVPAVGTKGFGSDINGNSASYSKSMQLALSDTHAFSATLINEARINYTRGTFSDDFTPQFNIKTGQNLSTQLGLPSLTKGGMPLFLLSTDTNGFDAFSNIGNSGSTNNFNVEERYNATDIVYLNRGTMSWTFGAEADHALLNEIPFFGASGGRWDFRSIQTASTVSTTQNTALAGNPFASYLLGVPNLVLDRPVLISYHYRWNDGAAFVQNDWKIRPNVTLNLGLRYSLQTPRTEENNLQGSFLPALAQTFQLATPNNSIPGQTITSLVVPPFAYSGRGGRSPYITPIKWLDFEPRFGIAWSPKLNGWNQSDHFVVRAGYALSHAPLTGNNRLPNPDFGATTNITTNNFNPTPTPAVPPTASTGSVDPNSAIRLSSNPPLLTPMSAQQALNIPANGLVFLDPNNPNNPNSLAIPGFVVTNNTSVPYVQNWNLGIQYQPFRNTVLEVSYVGAKGTHLFMPLVNSNPRDFATINNMENLGVVPDTTIPDPLGRKDLSGNIIQIPIGSLASKFGGFNHLYNFYDTSADSIRHAGYVNLTHRVSSGLSVTANYTHGKSMDDASDGSPDKGVLTSGFTSGGNATFGAPRSTDRSISSFDIKDTFNTTVLYDLPFGHGRQFLQNAWKPIEVVAGNWTVSSVFRLQGGFPFLPTIADGNGLSSDLTHTIRPDLVPGVPLVNPLYNRNCVVSSTCEPYVNPAAFERPVKGQLGNAPRTLDIRGPMQQYFDASVQKSFPFPFGWGDEGKRRIQFRMDLLNALNHPNFRISSGNAGPDLFGQPFEATVVPNKAGGGFTITSLTDAEYNTWATANGQPIIGTAGGNALVANIRQMITAQRSQQTATTPGSLPLDFFHVPLPKGFVSTPATAFDITTLNGYKLYRLRQAYATSANFGQLRELGLPRYVQFGLKIYF